MTSMPLALKAVVLLALCLGGAAVLVSLRASAREAAVEAAYPPAGQLIRVDGTDIHVKIVGQGPDIVMIHGASGSMRDFTFDLAERLSGQYRVITVDRPGFGWSGRPPGYGGLWNTADEPPDLQADLLQKAVARIGVQNPIVLGHSYGGAIALAWALRQPDTTAGLVLLAAASNRWEGPLGRLYRVNSTALGGTVVPALIAAFASHGAVEETLAHIFAPQQPPPGYMEHFGTDMTLRRKTLRANAQQVNALKPYVTEMAGRYHTLTLPVEIVHGTADDTVPIDVHSIPLSRQIPGAVLTPLEGVGHMPHHADPEAVVSAIDRVARRAGLR